MNLNYSEEQTMLREQIQKFCESEYDFYKREDVVKSDKDFDENVWSLFAEQGWLSMPFSEERLSPFLEFHLVIRRFVHQLHYGLFLLLHQPPLPLSK